MTNIENTEASIVKDILGRNRCEITKLAGNIGDSVIKMYQVNNKEFDGNLNLCPHLGLEFVADSRCLHISILSSDKSFPLYKGDNVRFKFIDDSYMQITFLVGGSQHGREKRNFVILSDREVLQLIEVPIEYVELSNYKTGEICVYKFCNKYNNQYKGELEGRSLLQIMIRRIVGLKAFLDKE